MRSFTAILGLQNRLVNKEIELWVAILGSFENEALENEDRSTKHPKLENEAP